MEWLLIPFSVFFLPLGIIFAVLSLWLRWVKSTKRRNPLTRDLLRAPGQSLEAKLQGDELDLSPYLFSAILGPVFLYAAVLSWHVFARKPFTLASVIVAVLAGIALIGYSIFKLVQIARVRLKYRLGLDAEMAVGQELNQLMRHGYWVFHDLPAENFNVDHVVVGRGGVFALETKGRAKPGKEVKDAWKVEYDGDRLLFPGWIETKPLEQTARQAKWLQQWLSSAVGESVEVRPILVLPGWWIERTSPRGMPVFNARNPEKLFKSLAKGPMSDKLVQQIVHQLDQRCRNVAARAYAAD